MLFFTFFVDTWDILMPVLIAIAFIGLCTFIGLAIREGRKQVHQNQKANQDVDSNDNMDDSDDVWTPPEPVAYPARVVDMRAVIGNVGGHKRPKTDTSFLVTFLTDGGDRVEYPVPEELYITLDIDRTGTLIILNDGFFDFGDGEDVEESPDDAGV